MDSRVDFALDRSRLLAPNLPPGSALGPMTSYGNDLNRAGVTELARTATPATMTSLAQYQSRFLPSTMSMHSPGEFSQFGADACACLRACVRVRARVCVRTCVCVRALALAQEFWYVCLPVVLRSSALTLLIFPAVNVWLFRLWRITWSFSTHPFFACFAVWSCTDSSQCSLPCPFVCLSFYPLAQHFLSSYSLVWQRENQISRTHYSSGRKILWTS